ncbi:MULTISPECIES: cysteine peptidase family C39 domain-containing protein [unclassified Leptolyngbya]|uniref:cysteine peptidase family C39 domain-containing protein n=1 Tax=unclassified Leptolyngbya TaxID=2650499 RepID=UPI00168614FF|nr:MULTISPECIES: cysteine peptidase family C39 domain-containing protein [unclassified Leptolyngbya]MBD1912721.1 peptidoglycan-binding protein [Leptolyngbya sp. FACHB-8]MBD2154656.1 peptidoglycan-binding protein [Leptolyngbya sp. FACHB-16]
MVLSLVSTILLGGLAFWWGTRTGHWLLRRGATARDLFQGRNWLSVVFLGLYIGMMLLVLYAPQWNWLPLEWRVYGMRVTWTAMRVILLGVCGVGFIVTWYTLRKQVLAIALIGVLGLASFTTAENYLLEPIYSTLQDNLLPNGVYQQTSTSSCAAAAMATVMRRWGIDAPESRVAKLAETSRMGTTMPQLIVAARELGLDGVEVNNTTWKQMQRINRPGVLASWLISNNGRRKSPHAIGLLEISDTNAVIADPAWGRVYFLAPDELAHIWRKEYVPFFRPEAINLSPQQVQDYLQRSGYLTPGSGDVTAALKQFQSDFAVRQTGEVDSITALLLSGPFIENAPRLDRTESVQPK